MKWIKKTDRFELSREELVTLSDFETCLSLNPKNYRPANFDDEEIIKIRKNLMKVLGAYCTKSFIKKCQKSGA